MKLIIFDFDGTIADTNNAIVRTYQESFRRMGLPIPSPEEVTPFIGLISEKIFTTLHPELDKETVAKAVLAHRELFYEVGAPLVKLFDNVKETLDRLRDMGLVMTVASSRNIKSLEYLIDRFGLREYFQLIIGAESVKHHKPAPDMPLLILEKLGIEPQEAVVIGDTLFDLGMGSSAGCHTCGVTFGNHSREKLATAEPDWLVDSFDALPDIFA